MILDERTYALHPAHVKEYLDLYLREGMELQASHLGHLICWFTTDVGTVNEVVHMWRFEGLGDRTSVGAMKRPQRRNSHQDIRLRPELRMPHPAPIRR